MGRQFVLQLPAYEQADEIWVIARRESELEKLKAQCSLPVRPIPLDLCKDERFAAYRQPLREEKPNVKLLVNAAGFGKFGHFENVPLEEKCCFLILGQSATGYTHSVNTPV